MSPQMKDQFTGIAHSIGLFALGLIVFCAVFVCTATVVQAFLKVGMY